MATTADRLASFLIDKGFISPEELQAAAARAEAANVPLPRLLLQEGRLTEKQLLMAVAYQNGMRFFDFAAEPMHPDAVAAVPAELCHRFNVIGVGFEGDRLVLAMVDPKNGDAIQAVQQTTGWGVIPALADRQEVAAAIKQVHGAPAAGAAPAGGESGRLQTGDVKLAAGADRLMEAARGVKEEPPPVQVQKSAEDIHVNELLEIVLERGASDLHLTVGAHPTIRVHGDLYPLTEFPILKPGPLRKMIYAILTQKQREKLESELELDMSHPLPGKARFRVNVFFQRDSIGAVMRVIPMNILPLEKLGLPPVLSSFAYLPRGLVLVTGPTGSGKSTTLASIIDIINRERPVHIMTVEDPIEFLHTHKRAIVNQREVGEDTHSFASALKRVLRQDPDVILVGEMRDLETIATAITAAETGHLVFGTLHTQDAPQSIDRIIDVFPPHQQQQVRIQLASSLQAVCTQQLLQTADGRGRVVACEVLICTPAVRNLIREGKTHQIYSVMQAGGRFGMQTMDQSLADLVKAGKISLDMARERCANEEDLMRLLGKL
jgi:twitching motility protein PilT